MAVESTEETVREVALAKGLSFPVILGTPELATRFGDLLAVPTTLVFDREGKALGQFLGAPPDLHEEIEALLVRALGKPASSGAPAGESR